MGPPDPAQKGVLNRPFWRPYLGAYLGGSKGAKSRVWPSGALMYSSHNGPQKGPILGLQGPYLGPPFGGVYGAKSRVWPSGASM
jgi:hypothetical protein